RGGAARDRGGGSVPDGRRGGRGHGQDDDDGNAVRGYAAISRSPRSLSRALPGAGSDVPDPLTKGPDRTGPPAVQPRSSSWASSVWLTSPGFFPRMIIPRMSSVETSCLLTVSTIRPWYMTLTRSARS